MLAAHPEIRDLMRPAPSTAVWCVLVAGLQVGLALYAANLSWGWVVGLAWLCGAWLNMAMFELAHQCNHSLVFKKTSWNRWLFTLVSLPMFLSAHHTWWVEHLVHHNDLGAKKDFITRRRTLLLMTRRASPMFLPYSLPMLVLQLGRSIVGLVVYMGGLLRGRLEPSWLALAILGDAHLISGYRKSRITHWAVVYPLLNIALTVALFGLAGWKAVVYLLASQTFMTGFLHPVMFGIILSTSHFYGHRHYQPTASYYGWLNKLTFNNGMHTEHHDIAAIPWQHMPKLRRIAPEFFEPLTTVKSYVGLALEFVFGGSETMAVKFDHEEYMNRRRFTELAAAGPNSR